MIQRCKNDRTPADSLARFYQSVRKTLSCWLWKGALNNKGYGMFMCDRHRYSAHRWIFQRMNHAVPADWDIRHKCDTPACVRPDHLDAGTTRENVLDAVARDRHPFSKLTVAQVVKIRSDKTWIAKPSAVLAAQLGVTTRTIERVRKGEVFKSVTEVCV